MLELWSSSRAPPNRHKKVDLGLTLRRTLETLLTAGRAIRFLRNWVSWSFPRAPKAFVSSLFCVFSYLFAMRVLSQVSNNTIGSLIMHLTQSRNIIFQGAPIIHTLGIPPSVPTPPGSPSSRFFPKGGCLFHTLLLGTPIIQHKLPNSRGIASRQ